MKEVLKYSNCFVCGDCNPHGLQAKFFFDGEKAITEVVAGEQFEGYRSVFHGGVISALLDEVMIKAILADGIFAVTAEMTVRFHAPVRTGERLTLTGKVVERKGRMFLTEGRAVNGLGETVASASGKYLEARPEMKSILMQSIE